MSDLEFEVLDAQPEPYAAVPTIMLRLRITERSGMPVHAVALRCQIRIEPQRRRYTDAETRGSGRGVRRAHRSGADSLRPFLWTHVSTTLSSFSGSTEVDLPVTCTYDFEVSGTKYFHALDDGEIPLVLLFSGTTFVAGADGFSVAPVAWHEEAAFRLPVAVWQGMMDALLPEPRVGHREPRDPRRAPPVPRRARAAHLGPGPRTAAEGSRGGGGGAVTDRFDAARAVADAVLFEGYVLYPYRASAPEEPDPVAVGCALPAGIRRGGRLRAVGGTAPSAWSTPGARPG